MLEVLDAQKGITGCAPEQVAAALMRSTRYMCVILKLQTKSV
jgi:hypothetical protein